MRQQLVRIVDSSLHEYFEIKSLFRIQHSTELYLRNSGGVELMLV